MIKIEIHFKECNRLFTVSFDVHLTFLFIAGFCEEELQYFIAFWNKSLELESRTGTAIDGHRRPFHICMCRWILRGRAVFEFLSELEFYGNNVDQCWNILQIFVLVK